MQTVDVDQAARDWLTLAEAGQRERVSVDTIRRRLKRGEPEARLARPPRARLAGAGGQLAGVLPTISSTPMQPAQGVDTFELLHLVRDQQQTILELSGRCEYYQAQLEQAHERIRALEAPREPETAEVHPGVRGRFRAR
jgi:hypothetical protein